MAAKKGTRRPRACGPESKKPRAHEREAPKRLPPASSGRTADRVRIDLGVDPKRIDESIRELREQVSRWVKRGVADKVRISYKGKPLAPDIPVYYFLAAEALTFWATGFLRILILNLGAKAFLQVELISSAAEHHANGMRHYLEGDVDRAVECFEHGVASDDYHAPSHLMLGVTRKVKGDWSAARRHFERAAMLDEKGETGAKAREHLRNMSRRLDDPPSDDAE